MSPPYASLCNELASRIASLGKSNPEIKQKILAMDDAWDLFRIPGFQCGDLGPSMAQAYGALRAAQATLKTQD